MTDVIERSVAHATFSIERTYAATPARVFQAFADPAAKRRWFAEGEGWEIESFDVDFRVGGIEKSRFRFSRRAAYFERYGAPGHRAGSADYHCLRHVGWRDADLGIAGNDTGSKLTYTEQGAFLDGQDQAAGREEGCRELLEALARELGCA